MRTSWWLVLAVVLGASVAVGAKSEAEKAKQKAEKKLDAFEKTYDPTKDLSRKNPEKLQKDIAELDDALTELKGLDAAAAGELTARRDGLVQKANEGVSGAVAGKNDELFQKNLAKLEKDFDPEKKRLADLDASTIKRARDELDRTIAKFEPAARKPYEDKRDAFFEKLKKDIDAAKVTKTRDEIVKEVPDLKPAPGVEAIAAGAPTWCDGTEKAFEPLYANYHVRALSMNSDTPGARLLAQAVVFSCRDPGHDARQKWVAWFRQNLSNTFGLTAADNERLMKLGAKVAVSDDLDKQQKDTCAQFESLKEGPAEQRFSRALLRVGLMCPGRLVDQADGVPLNAIDVPDGVGSQVAGAVLANTLTTQGFSSEDGRLTGFAVANATITFDPAKFEKELAEWKLNDVGTINAVETFYGSAAKMKALEVLARKRSAAVLLDAPKKGVKAFLEALPKNKPLIDTALALEDQKRSGGLKGCGAKLYPEVAAVVKGEKATYDEVRLDGLLAYKLTLCALNDPDAPGMQRVFGYYAERSTAVRGPFTAAYLALLDAHNANSGAPKAEFDPRAKRGAGPSDGSGPFAPGRSPVDAPELDLGNTLNPMTTPTGIVKSVEAQGALTKIVFRTEHYMVPVLDCVETGRIDRILPDGTILYRKSCKVTGQQEVTATNEPITVPSYAANGVSPGSFLVYESAAVNDDVKGQPHRGWVIEAYESKAKKKRTSLFGVAQ